MKKRNEVLEKIKIEFNIFQGVERFIAKACHGRDAEIHVAWTEEDYSLLEHYIYKEKKAFPAKVSPDLGQYFERIICWSSKKFISQHQEQWSSQESSAVSSNNNTGIILPPSLQQVLTDMHVRIQELEEADMFRVQEHEVRIQELEEAYIGEPAMKIQLLSWLHYFNWIENHTYWEINHWRG